MKSQLGRVFFKMSGIYCSNLDRPPTQDSSHHQDDDIAFFRKESQHKPSFATGILRPGILILAGGWKFFLVEKILKYS